MRRFLTVLFACALAGALLAINIKTEVAVGGLRGVVTMQENGLPLPHALIVVTPVSEDIDVKSRNWHTETQKDGSFSLSNVPAGEYYFEVEAENHRLSDRQCTVTEGHVADLDVRLKPNDYSFTLFCNQHVIAPQQIARIELSGFVKEDSFQLGLHRIKLSSITESGSVEAALQPLTSRLYGASSGNGDITAKDFDSFSTLTWSSEDKIKQKDVEGSFTQAVKLPPLQEGLFVLTARIGNRLQTTFLNVSKIALVTKSTEDKTLCYVTDIDSGKPMQGVQLFQSKAKVLQPAVKTDGQGLATVVGSGKEQNPIVVAQLGNSVAVCGMQTASSGGDEDEEVDPNVRVYTYADRPIYRPGDTVQFKSVVRKLVGDDLQLPAPGTAKIEVFDPQENLLNTQSVPLTQHGTLHGSFATNAEAPPGVYKIRVYAAKGVDNYYANFAAYRKPDYSIKVTPNQKRYTMGDDVSANVECQYFFGGPVVGAKVTASIYRNPTWDASFDTDDSEDDSSGDDESDSEGYSGGEYVQEVTAVTDGTGKAVITFPTVPKADSKNQGEPDFDYTYSIQANVMEGDTRSFDGSGSVLVTRGDFRLSATTDPYIVSVGQKANLIVSTTTLDEPSLPKPNRSVFVEVGTDLWTRHTEVFQKTQSLTVQTGADGKAIVPLTIGKQQTLRIRVSTADDGGHKIQSETWLYVEGSLSFDPSSNEAIKVKLDRAKYNVGDTVKALLTTNSPGGSALLTVESDNVKLVRLVALDKPSATVEFPVGKECSPNAFVSVAYVHARKYSSATHRLTVKRQNKQLTVSVTPDRTKALPGTSVAFQVRTTDHEGHGVPADVSLGVVDEAIYAIREDTTNIVKGMYPMRYDAVQTSYSFPEVYLDGGDKGGGAVAVRRNFRDTASWAPEVLTDRSGDGTITVKLPDNLTSWRATAVAATDDSQVGMTTSNVIVSKPLMVRLLTPQFMVGADTQTVSASITNDSGTDLNISLSTRLSGVALQNRPPGNLHLAQGQTISVPLAVAASASGTADIVAEVRSDRGFTDAVEGHFPVLPHGRLVTDHKSGLLEGTASLDLNALPNRDRNTGGLTVSITPSVVTGMVQSLDQLVQYPYGCVEQTTSRFLPAVLVTHTIHNTPLRRPDLEKKAAAIAQDGFQRLLKMQHSDGAWGWWTYDSSDPFMTAWVLDGLKRSAKAGYPAPPYLNVKSALSWSAKRLKSPFKDDPLAAQMFLAYALAEYGDTASAKEELHRVKLINAGAGEMALAALAANAVGDATLRDECLSQMVPLLNSHNVAPRVYDGLWMDNEHYALGLLALTELKPNAPEIPSLVRLLLSNRGCDGWSSTRETALTISALCNYISQSKMQFQPYPLTVTLNGQELKRITVDPSKADSPDLTLRVPVAQLRDGPNRLELVSPNGKPYYAAELRQYDVRGHIPQILEDKQFSVQRNYYRMEARQQDDGTLKLLPSKDPITTARPGDVVRCVLKVYCAAPVNFLMIEDPIPSNCRVTDREDPDEGQDWTFWWSSIVIRDDRVSLFARQMPSGMHVLEYTMRVEGPGKAAALPTYVEDMYDPNINTSGGETDLEVRE
ncbi:MAG TPA: MG2 domain-containing protein [Fimbriimonas sp.]|nr:MG2 domain-containing protein [Fimbriimonas sp.]